MKSYVIQYRHKGKQRNLYLHAEGFDDACEQVIAARSSGDVYEIVSTFELAGFSRRLDVLGWCLFLAAMAVVFWR